MPLLNSLGETAWQAGSAGRLEVLVQDDASPDVDLREMLRAPFSVARNEINLGFAGNCNAGAHRAKGDVLFFLNQDTRARPGWLEPLMAAFDNPKVGIVGPKLIFPNAVGEDCIQSCGGLYDAGKGPFHRFIGFMADDWRVNRAERVSWTTGAALAVRRDLFWQVGGFDTGYRRGYFEDVALCEAVKSLGYEIWYEPRAVFVHRVGSTGGIPPEIFRANSVRFHRQWNAKIKPDTDVKHVDF